MKIEESKLDAQQEQLDIPVVSNPVCQHQNIASVAGIITCLDCGECLCDY